MGPIENQTHEEAHAEFWSTLDPAHRYLAERICREDGGGDFDEGCLGFLGTYWLLARLIPTDRVVYDVGCAHAFQAWFFRGHRGYVGISDSPARSRRFTTQNAGHYLGRIEEWAQHFRPEPLHFAIHNYCPSGREAVARTFRDLYTFYPQGSTIDLPGMPR